MLQQQQQPPRRCSCDATVPQQLRYGRGAVAEEGSCLGFWAVRQHHFCGNQLDSGPACLAQKQWGMDTEVWGPAWLVDDDDECVLFHVSDRSA